MDSNNDPAHFHKTTATSTFLIMRVSTKVTALERGRNEVPNSRVAAIFDRIRNVAISIGAVLGLSKFQWGKLMKGILKGPPQS